MKNYITWKEDAKVSSFFPEFKRDYVTRFWDKILLDKFEETLEFTFDSRMMIDSIKFEGCIKATLLPLKSKPGFHEYKRASLELKQCVDGGPSAPDWDTGYRLERLSEWSNNCEAKLFAGAVDTFQKMITAQNAYRIRSLCELIPDPFSRDYFNRSRSKDLNMLFSGSDQLTTEIDSSLDYDFPKEVINLIVSYAKEDDSEKGICQRFAELLKDFELIRSIWSLKSFKYPTRYFVDNFIAIMEQKAKNPQGEIELHWQEGGRCGTEYPSIAAAYKVLVNRQSFESCLAESKTFLNAEEFGYVELFVSLGLKIMGNHEILTSSTIRLAQEVKGIPNLINLKLALNKKIQNKFGIENGITIITGMPSFPGQLIICAQKSVINYLLSLGMQAETTTDSEFKWSAAGFKKTVQETVISCLSPFTKVAEEKTSFFTFSFGSSSSSPSSNKNPMLELQGKCKQLIGSITDEHNGMDGILAVEAIYQYIILTSEKISSDEAVRRALGDARKKTEQLRTVCVLAYIPMQAVAKTSTESKHSSFIAEASQNGFVQNAAFMVRLLTKFANKKPKQWDWLKDADNKSIGIEIGVNGISKRPSLATQTAMIVLTADSKLIVLNKEDDYKVLDRDASKQIITSYARKILELVPLDQFQLIYNSFENDISATDQALDWMHSGGLSA